MELFNLIQDYANFDNSQLSHSLENGVLPKDLLKVPIHNHITPKNMKLKHL